MRNVAIRIMTRLILFQEKHAMFAWKTHVLIIHAKTENVNLDQNQANSHVSVIWDTQDIYATQY